MSEVRELTNQELDAVCGGSFNFASYDWIKQTNNNYQTARAYGGDSKWGDGGSALAANVLGSQTNLAQIG
jgi:hypothetical protein